MYQAIAVGALATLQVVGGIHQSEMIRAQAALRQRLDDMNADAAEVDAYKAEVEGFSETARYQSVIDHTIADQRLAFTSQNIDANYGTAAQIQEESKFTGYVNILDIQRQAREKALGFKNDARNIRLGAGYRRMASNAEAAAQQFSGIVQGAGTVTGYAARSGAFSSSKSEPSWFFGTSPRGHAQPVGG